MLLCFGCNKFDKKIVGCNHSDNVYFITTYGHIVIITCWYPHSPGFFAECNLSISD